MLSTSRRIRVALSMLGLVTVLTACGGGGGGGGSSGAAGTVASANSFPFATANANLINNVYTDTFSITGWQIVNGVKYNVTGTGTVAQSATTSTTFEGQAALLNTQTINGTITVNGTTILNYPLPTMTVQSYSTSNYLPLGMVDSDEYCKMQGTPTLPATVKVGDAAVVGTYSCWKDSSKTAVIGTAKISFAIAADTASTAIVNITEQDYDITSTLQLTAQASWRIDAFGSVTFVSETVSDGLTYSYTFN